jgi:hypothetical protein
MDAGAVCRPMDWLTVLAGTPLACDSARNRFKARATMWQPIGKPTHFRGEPHGNPACRFSFFVFRLSLAR